MLLPYFFGVWGGGGHVAPSRSLFTPPCSTTVPFLHSKKGVCMEGGEDCVAATWLLSERGGARIQHQMLLAYSNLQHCGALTANLERGVHSRVEECTAAILLFSGGGEGVSNTKRSLLTPP